MYSIFENLLKLHKTNAYQVSKATGITTSTFSEWKKGTYVPKIDKLQKIADYFDVTIDYLMGIDKYIVEDVEPEYINVIREAKEEGFTADDIRLALNLLKMANRSGK